MANSGGISTLQLTTGFNNVQQNSVNIAAQAFFAPVANGIGEP